MADERFLQRWSRLKAAVPAATPTLSRAAHMQRVPRHPSVPGTPEHAVMPGAMLPEAVAPDPGPVDARLVEAASPTLADAALLDAESDYAPFVARGVGASVRRLAMKKLFADPHFNLIDGLDLYMADYNLPDPVSPAMLAALTHARNVLPHPDDSDDPAGPVDPTAPAAPASPADSVAPAQPPSSTPGVHAQPSAAPSTPSTPFTDEETLHEITRCDPQ
ncbi:MAG: DUF3306 domain-containing protein [Massilia sp.]|nr:DUF3306 domain-containing protein [Massilia sp.]